jgi:prefoldin subunit 5
MDIGNSAKSPLQEAFEIAAQIIAGENGALLERISQLEQQLESMNEKILQLQDELLQLQQGMPLIPVTEEKS